MEKKQITLKRVQTRKRELNSLYGDKRLKSSEYITKNCQTDLTIEATSVMDLAN